MQVNDGDKDDADAAADADADADDATHHVRRVRGGPLFDGDGRSVLHYAGECTNNTNKTENPYIIHYPKLKTLNPKP